MLSPAVDPLPPIDWRDCLLCHLDYLFLYLCPLVGHWEELDWHPETFEREIGLLELGEAADSCQQILRHPSQLQ